MEIIEKNTHLEKQKEESIESLRDKVRSLEEQVEKKRLKERIKELEDELNGNQKHTKPYWMSDDEKDKMKDFDRYLHEHTTFDPAKFGDGLFRNSFGMPMPRTWQEFDWLTKFYS